MVQLRSMPVLSDVAVTFLSSIVVLTPNGNFWTVPLLHSVTGVSHQTHRTMARFWGRICGFYSALWGVYRVLVGKPEEKRPLGRPTRRWVDNIRMDLQVGYGHVDWIGLAQVRDRWRTLVSPAMNLRVPWNAGNLLTSCKPVSFSGRTLHHGISIPLFTAGKMVPFGNIYRVHD
jgi:hypothetical protein